MTKLLFLNVISIQLLDLCLRKTYTERDYIRKRHNLKPNGNLPKGIILTKGIEEQ